MRLLQAFCSMSASLDVRFFLIDNAGSAIVAAPQEPLCPQVSKMVSL